MRRRHLTEPRVRQRLIVPVSPSHPERVSYRRSVRSNSGVQGSIRSPPAKRGLSLGKRASSSLMWTAPETASAICSAEVHPVAPPIGDECLSRVRSLLAVRPPENLRHDRHVAPARASSASAVALFASLEWQLSRHSPKSGRACPRASAPRQPTVPVDCAGFGRPAI